MIVVAVLEAWPWWSGQIATAGVAAPAEIAAVVVDPVHRTNLQSAVVGIVAVGSIVLGQKGFPQAAVWWSIQIVPQSAVAGVVAGTAESIVPCRTSLPQPAFVRCLNQIIPLIAEVAVSGWPSRIRRDHRQQGQCSVADFVSRQTILHWVGYRSLC